MIHVRGSCTGGWTGKSLVKWEAMVRKRERKTWQEKKGFQVGGGR